MDSPAPRGLHLGAAWEEFIPPTGERPLAEARRTDSGPGDPEGDPGARAHGAPFPPGPALRKAPIPWRRVVRTVTLTFQPRFPSTQLEALDRMLNTVGKYAKSEDQEGKKMARTSFVCVCVLY